MLALIDLLLSSSGNATPSANSGSLTLDFRERTLAPCIFQVQDHFVFLFLRNHSHTTTISRALTQQARFTEIGHIFIINMFEESSISLVCF